MYRGAGKQMEEIVAAFVHERGEPPVHVRMYVCVRVCVCVCVCVCVYLYGVVCVLCAG